MPEAVVPLHVPVFSGKEKEYLVDCIDSTFVSTIGEYVNLLEKSMCRLTGAKYATATVNGTSGLHAALAVAGVRKDCEVLTQSLTFVATANAISYCCGEPIFLDVDRETLGLDPIAVENFLQSKSVLKNGSCYNKDTGKRIAACVPMHTFGHPCKIQQIVNVCSEFKIPVIEDAAEALGSVRGGQHCGTFGLAGVFSFNGNKIVTSGGGGIIVTNDKEYAQKVRYLTTTAKKTHPYLYEHTEVGFNYRLPNINAALACAQLEQLDSFIENKRKTAKMYQDFFKMNGWQYICEPAECRSNYWLQAILLSGKDQRDIFLEETNNAGIMTRPVWKMLNELQMYKHCQTDSLKNARFFADRLINLPSSVRL